MPNPPRKRWSVTPSTCIAASSSLATVGPEAVLLVGGEVGQLGHEHLAHLAGGAGHQRDAAPLLDVARHRGAVVDRLVVGVGVDQQQALVGRVGHGTSLRSQQRAQLGEEGSVRREPVDLVEILGGQPPDQVVLGRPRLARLDPGGGDPERVVLPDRHLRGQPARDRR